MTENLRARAILFAPLVASGLLVSGCVSSPTYGTDKTSTAQLTSDLTGILSTKRTTPPSTEYKPRPELVKPASMTDLPAPQENIVTASNGTGAWPESPEQKRARLRAEATANQDNVLYEPTIVNDMPVAPRSGKTPSQMQDADAKPMSNVESRATREAFNRRLAENNQGSESKRKFLSEPPLTYRVPADTASVGDVGEDEVKKERRIKKMARKKGDGGWRDLVPWL